MKICFPTVWPIVKFLLLILGRVELSVYSSVALEKDGNRGAESHVWLFQIVFKQQRVTLFQGNPKGYD